MTENTPRIILDNISKKFYPEHKNNDSTLARVLNFSLKGSGRKEVQALSNISFRVNDGEVLGVMGRNASGKSTLLRIIAKIYNPDKGMVATNGSVVYLPGLDLGLALKLTMRENIYLMSSLRGLGRKDIRRKFDEIVEFSGLENFVDVKTYQFSSGMISRLNFSVAMACLEHHNPEIVLLDEVFGAGGDINFQLKATGKMENIIKKGATVVLVMHSLDIIKKYCGKAVLLEKGKVVAIGKPEEVIKSYIINSHNI